MVKEFEYFVGRGDVKKQSPNLNLARATLNESKDRLELAKFLLQAGKIKYALENAYESSREYADSILFADGYKSYSHEASIAYLSEKGVSPRLIFELDRFRRIRNDIKYYGKDCDIQDAKAAIELAEKLITQETNYPTK